MTSIRSPGPPPGGPRRLPRLTSSRFGYFTWIRVDYHPHMSAAIQDRRRSKNQHLQTWPRDHVADGSISFFWCAVVVVGVVVVVETAVQGNHHTYMDCALLRRETSSGVRRGGASCVGERLIWFGFLRKDDLSVDFFQKARVNPISLSLSFSFSLSLSLNALCGG